MQIEKLQFRYFEIKEIAKAAICEFSVSKFLFIVLKVIDFSQNWKFHLNISSTLIGVGVLSKQCHQMWRKIFNLGKN